MFEIGSVGLVETQLFFFFFFFFFTPLENPIFFKSPFVDDSVNFLCIWMHSRSNFHIAEFMKQQKVSSYMTH